MPGIAAFDRLADLAPRSRGNAGLCNGPAEGMGAANPQFLPCKRFVAFVQLVRRNWPAGRQPASARVAKADEKADRRRQRRALAEAELVKLLARRGTSPAAGRVWPADRPQAERPSEAKAGYLDDVAACRRRPRRRNGSGAGTARQEPGPGCRAGSLGRERALIYKTLVLTGLRKGELASITVGQLVLDADPPSLVLDAADEKNREGSTIPLRADLAADLRQWLADKARLQEPPGAGGLTETPGRSRGPCRARPTAAGYRGDAAARYATSSPCRPAWCEFSTATCCLPGIPKRDERGRTVDVHAMRHTFGTLLSKGGVSPRTAQAAMRHSKIDLTMNIYTDPKLLDVAGAMECSAGAASCGKGEQSGSRRRKGNRDRRFRPLRQFAPKFAPTTGKPCILESILDKIDQQKQGKRGRRGRRRKCLPCQKKRPADNVLSTGRFERGRRESNPQPSDRQSDALTN